MPDLIEKFFREDLTEAEEQALEELLESSEDGADKLMAIAEKNYYRYGLPTPRLPEGGTPPAGPRASVKPWILLSIFATAFLAALFYCHKTGMISKGLSYFSGKPSADISSPGPSLESNHPSANSHPEAAGVESRLQVKTSAAGLEEDALSTTSTLNKRKAVEEKVTALNPVNRAPVESSVLARVLPVVTPINLDESPSQKFSGISVEVKQSEPGYVAVRVLDMSGLEVTPLYSGNLATGRWAFTWDGQLGKGQQAKPGYYQVEVKSGSFVGRKNILIK